MPHVITQHCCNDAACVSACPVDCIHPRPDEPDYLTAEMLYIDPDVCVDCGACIQVCPVDAIRPKDDLAADKVQYLQINARYAADAPVRAPRAPADARVPDGLRPLRVAVVGAGPAGMYAAEELLARTDVDASVDVFDRLPTPGGLIRAGVAPDHALTKGAGAFFQWTQRRPGFRFHLGVEIGRDLGHEDLARHFDAVLYTHGASVGRQLGVPGEDRTGCVAGSDFVAWYNGHPNFADRDFDLSSERVVVIGNGNVALDVARILTADPDELARTEISDHALATLRSSQVREVVVVGRRGAENAAYTAPELEALGRLRDVDVVVDDAGLAPQDESEPLKVGFARTLAATAPTGASRRIVLRFLRTPVEVLGDDAVTGVRFDVNEPDGTGVRATGEQETLETRLVITAVGHRGVAIDSLPFDDTRGLVPNRGGRVVDAAGDQLPGVYVAGWIKRGPSGVIGTNKWCSAETVGALLEDHVAGRLEAPAASARAFDVLLNEKCPGRLDRSGWDAIDAAERRAGAEQGRPRAKLLRWDDLVAAGRGAAADR